MTALWPQTVYYAEVAVGTPPQKLRVMFATGSADTWLPASACVNDACTEHVRYNVSASSTFTKSDVAFNITVRIDPISIMTSLR